MPLATKLSPGAISSGSGAPLPNQAPATAKLPESSMEFPSTTGQKSSPGQQMTTQTSFSSESLVEPLAKRLKTEHDERIDATNSLASLAEGHPQKPQQNPEQTSLPQLEYNQQPQKDRDLPQPSTFVTNPREKQPSRAKSSGTKSTSVKAAVRGVRMPKREGPPITLNTKEVEDILEELYPVRRHLGTIIYNPTTTWATLQILLLPGLKEEDFDRLIEIKQSYVDKLLEPFGNYEIKYIPMIPPVDCQYINYTIEMKIPARFIETFKFKLDNNETKRELWGGAGGIYTDDSDILSVLAHIGLFNNNINLKPWNKDKNWRLIQPLISKPGDVIPGDLSVEILLLPPLPQYNGFYANGINSRSWTSPNKHNGLSIAIHNVKWETCDTYLRDKQTFKRYQGEMALDKQLTKDIMNSKPGWKFNVEYYKQLKQKFSDLEPVVQVKE
jgi:hypothetical protein